MSSIIIRIARAFKYPVLFGGYMYLVHWGWQTLQYNPIVNQGKEPAVINFEKFKKAFESKFGNKEDKKNEKGEDSKESN